MTASRCDPVSCSRPDTTRCRSANHRVGITLTVLVVVLSLVGTALGAKGVVAVRKRGCDYFLVEATNGFALLEWFGGTDPDLGDKVVGEFESFGMKNIYDPTSDAEGRVWVEDYGLSEDRAIEQLRRRCH